MKVSKVLKGNLDGKDVFLYQLCADNGTSICLTNIGGTVTSIKTADRNGKIGEVTLGFDDPMTYADPEYLSCGFYLGATIGRFANRIAGGKFTLNGKTYELETNDGENHLHGGSGSFNTKIWDSEDFSSEDRVGVRMTYVSPNMENGYPGELTVIVVFTLNSRNEFIINYQAKTDRATIVNLTNHSYFNLRGEGDIFDTNVVMQANNYTPREDDCIPDGTIESVKGTPFDFTLEHRVGERIAMLDDGYDHNFVINGNAGELRLAAEVWDDETGRKMEFLTTEPAFQFYTGYYLNGKYSRGPLKFNQFCGFCLEAQHYPDSPNQKTFPSVVLRPGETYSQTTVYKFGIK